MASRKQSVLDIRGQVCPSSLLMTLHTLNQNSDALRDGSMSLCVLSNSRDATVTIPNAAASMGFRSDVNKAPEGHYEIVIDNDDS